MFSWATLPTPPISVTPFVVLGHDSLGLAGAPGYMCEKILTVQIVTILCMVLIFPSAMVAGSQNGYLSGGAHSGHRTSHDEDTDLQRWT